MRRVVFIHSVYDLSLKFLHFVRRLHTPASKNLPAQTLMTRTLLITFMMECLEQDSLQRMILLPFSCPRHVETADTCSRQGQESFASARKKQ